MLAESPCGEEAAGVQMSPRCNCIADDRLRRANERRRSKRGYAERIIVSSILNLVTALRE